MTWPPQRFLGTPNPGHQGGVVQFHIINSVGCTFPFEATCTFTLDDGTTSEQTVQFQNSLSAPYVTVPANALALSLTCSQSQGYSEPVVP